MKNTYIVSNSVCMLSSICSLQSYTHISVNQIERKCIQMHTSHDQNRDSISQGQCRSISSYDRLNRIGEGTYGMVYRAIDRDTRCMVALKKIILHNEKQDGFPITSIREIATLRRICHINCVKMLDVVVGQKRDGVYLVFEYCEHDLSSLLMHFSDPFTESEVKSLSMQLLSALKYLHERWIIHRDIKLSNLLYNNRGQLKLADFGLARLFSHPRRTMTQKVVTLWYRAPEILLGSKVYTTAIDLWAVGCVMGELLLKKPLLPGDNELDQIHRIFNLLGSPSDRIWPTVGNMPLVRNGDISLAREQARHPYNNLHILFPRLKNQGLDLLNAFFTYDWTKRITARDALRHEYFDTSPYPKEPDMMPTFPTQHDVKDSRSDAPSSNSFSSRKRSSYTPPRRDHGYNFNSIFSSSSKHKRYK